MSDRIAVFNAGRIEQVGAPATLYEHPATRFVAGFVGEMNFLPGRILRSEGASVEVAVEDAILRAANPGRLAGGAEVVVAMRPEWLRAAAPGPGTLAARVVDAIYLGNARRLILRTAAGSELTMLQQAGAPAAAGPGETLGVSCEPGRVTVFAA